MRTSITDNMESIPALSPAEREQALAFWIKQQQKICFPREWQALHSQTCPPFNSPIRQLCPFLDIKGLMRVAGRLHNADLPADTMHPIIMCASSRLTLLLVTDAHERAHHGGLALTMSLVRHRYWIRRLRVLVRKVINRCVQCKRYRKEVAQQIMGSLPSARVTVSHPFRITGLDFAGPFDLRRRAGRPTRNQPVTTDKAWICVFVCMATRAVHLDLSHGLSVEAFLETFTRFTSRRGLCEELWSDNGTTFVGTNNELRRVRKEWENALPHQNLANMGTSWKFITPGAPHQGGIWEAGVKAVKGHLRRCLGDRLLTANQMYTFLTQVEACLNSRPLVPVSQDLSDPQPLTPGHFLIGRPLLQPLLTEDVADQPENRLTLWGRMQKLVASFWTRWRDEYLGTLQKRMKWFNAGANVKKDDIVIILNENTRPASWPLGRIVEVYPGADGFVRNVDVSTQTSKTVLKRPIQKIILLFNHNDSTILSPLQPGPGFSSSS